MIDTGERTSRVFAIVPAAGRSRRMGAAKQLLDVGGRPMLRDVVESIAAADVAGVVVIVKADIAGQAGVGDISGVAVVFNDDASSEMIDSVRIGVRHWMGAGALSKGDGFLVCPGDQPGIAAEDINRCITAFRGDSARIVIASHAGRRGHPIVFGSDLVDFVSSAECDGGLNALPRRHEGRVYDVACASPGVARDVDTPKDYREIAD